MHNNVNSIMRVVYVRCPTCNKVLSNKEYLYQSMIKTGTSAKDALDHLELEVCCRIRMLGHADVSNDILEQKHYNFMNTLNPPPKLNDQNFPVFKPHFPHQTYQVNQQHHKNSNQQQHQNGNQHQQNNQQNQLWEFNFDERDDVFGGRDGGCDGGRDSGLREHEGVSDDVFGGDMGGLFAKDENIKII